ncbi:MAG: penicillin acylase family protein [Pseudomonadota bacterium]
MRLIVRIVIGLVVIAVIGIAATWFLLPSLNDRQTDGELALPGLQAPVRVVRDEKAMPYIYANSMEDALRAQGFVAGQDRLFQLETAKRAASGRLAEVFGAGADDIIVNLDKEARVIGFRRIARRQLELLSPNARRSLTPYVEGLNSYITDHADTHPMAFSLAGFEPEIWTVEDLLTVVFFMGWGSAANFDAELIAHQVIQAIGEEKFQEIAPIVVNPDNPEAAPSEEETAATLSRWATKTGKPVVWTKGGWRQQGHGGSNNWAMSGAKSGSPAAVVTNDPHLDSRNLPGPWHPVALITPEVRVVGVSAGLPGVVIGRNDRIAFGVTNAYADAVDLYVETIDPDNPDNYMEGDQSVPFETISETVRIKDDTAENGIREEKLDIRLTRRGPVITDHDPKASDGAVLTMRWASAEYMDGELGLDALMAATTIEEALEAIGRAHMISLNFVVGDVNGRIGRRASGTAPIRLRGNGMVPFPVVDGEDNWGGRIPAEEMPGEIDPERGWTGTANHFTAPADYPYVYTTYASPSYRYRRMSEIFNEKPTISAQESWAAQYDTLNVFARDIAPIMAAALLEDQDADIQQIGQTLQDWNHRDDPGEVGPTLFQEVMRHFARLTYEDELGPEAVNAYLSSWYVWQERFDAMVQDGTSPWFDDIRTPETEDLADMIRRAGRAAQERLASDYGGNRENWRWGDVRKVRFQGPLRLNGWAGSLTGNRDVEMPGSGETVMRALYAYDKPFDSQWFASLRMTADLNDPDKVRAVLPGGAVGRTFHPHLADQLTDWTNKDAQIYWWFSDKAIEENTQSVLNLSPDAG